MSKRKSKVPYEDSHKFIEGVEHKLCSICTEWLPMNPEYYYKNKSSAIDGFNTYCKQCTKEKSESWRKNPNNRKAFLNNKRKRNQHPDHKKELQNAYEKRKESGYFRVYYSENREKFTQYRLNHMHKSHEISKHEWLECKKYFNNSCAYCGIKEEIAKLKQGQYLHREHAINNGANDITNCVPACKSCNSSKWENDYNVWYTSDNPVYDANRDKKITEWINEDCYNF